MKEETKTSIISALLFVLVLGGVGTVLMVFGIAPMFEEHTKTGTIERVELLPGHIGSTQDKCIVAFDDGTTIILDYRSFAESNKYVGKLVFMTYREYGQIINIKEVWS